MPDEDRPHDDRSDDRPDAEPPVGGAESAVADGDDESPIEGQILLLTAAKASVPPQELPGLVARAQSALGPRLDDYRRRYELVNETPDACAFLVQRGHWEEVGAELGFERRETDAIRRAHEEQLRRFGSREGRREEFEAALEIREAAVIGR
ncbi:hypothetical protein [Halegenticoccus soli]|uniref:hypothetical protein n=1 Tax=Halegenticoccus soli TaxID=1985678 RepID=UPI001E34AA9B|nr:hypothetical protein [Halegenticoccus soli]